VTVETRDSFLFKLKDAELVVERLGELAISLVEEDGYSRDQAGLIQTCKITREMTFRCDNDGVLPLLPTSKGGPHRNAFV
jgi:hypothetical protein